MYSGTKSNLIEVLNKINPTHPHNRLLHQHQLYQHEHEMEQMMIMNTKQNLQRERGDQKPCVVPMSDANHSLRRMNSMDDLSMLSLNLVDLTKKRVWMMMIRMGGIGKMPGITY
ncbi:hypothetical protein AQUCO_03300017v1 [Aquilegia coerulea]|uniref:Uncharacterized protein n=1 Tax=Aquilegia coerulea TaxID=218851 RepID=A0A2G5CZ50_AQUCA|nr:hypothetical protein AQUCO_03300017v1 [Aquilegia coerulea]PIA36538.1 hypothetical protein AQUCO_03300017v1 [Aquilegia coerulea]